MRHFDERRHDGRHHDHRGWHGMPRGGPDGFGREGFGPRGRHGGFGRDGAHRGAGRGGRRRMFDAGELRLVLLLLMESEPRHGYDLIREIETRTGGSYAPSPGIIYPTLTHLEELGHIEAAASEGPKRLFAITQDGRTELEARRREAVAAMARLDTLKAETDPVETGPVWRAMQNLKAVLMQRLSASPDKDTVFAATDLIDEAARKIERL